MPGSTSASTIIKLKLAPADNNVPYLTVYYTVGDFIFGSSILLAGWVCDRLEDRGFDMLSIYAGTFLLGWLGRTLVAALLVPIEEPGAWHVRDLAAHGVRKLFGGVPAVPELALVECFARLGVVLAGDREAAVRLRRAVVFRREGLGVFGREGPIDRPLELPILVDVDEEVGHRFGPAEFVDLFVVEPRAPLRRRGHRNASRLATASRGAGSSSRLRFVAGCFGYVGRVRFSSSTSTVVVLFVIIVDEVKLVVVQIFAIFVVGSHERRFLLVSQALSA